MQLYNKIAFWENRSRIIVLNKFKYLIKQYFNNVTYDWMEPEPVETEKSREMRTEINFIAKKVQRIIRVSDIATSYHYFLPPSTGGRTGSIDAIMGVFELYQYSMGEDEVLDVIEKAIGVYQDDYVRSIIRTFNPFFWLKLLLDYLLKLPFEFLIKIGFDKSSISKVETGTGGKLIKGLIVLILGGIIVEAVINILDVFGFWDSIKDSVKEIIK